MKKSIKCRNIVVLGLIFIIICLTTKFTYANNEEENEITNKEEVTYEINSIIETISEQGLTKSNLSEAVKVYQEVSKQYSNEEIAEILENNKDYLEQQNISSENIEKVTKILKEIDANQLNEALNKVDIEQAIEDIEAGATVQDVIEKTTENMTVTDKADLFFSLLWSANIIRSITIAIVILEIYKIIVRCIIYKKAGRHAWAILIPIYRQVTMLKICGMSPWWLLLLLLPVIGWILLWVVFVASRFMLAESFDKNPGFGFGLWLLWPIFESILAFSKKTKYVGIENEE